MKTEAPAAPYLEQPHRISRDERIARGRAMRDKVARGAQREWRSGTRRADPVDLLIKSSEGRVPHLLPIRYGRMLQSPFTFYRGAAAIMACDLSTSPSTGLPVQACGDCHLLNFGGFATPERKVILDINDFDETAVAPWEWDVQRLVASFVVAGRSNGFKRSQCLEAAWMAADSYRERIAVLADTNVLAAWYDTVELGTELNRFADPAMRRFYKAKLTKAQDTIAHSREFAKLAFSKGERPLIRDQPPLIYHPTDRADLKWLEVARKVFEGYVRNLPVDRRILLERFELTDAAVKVVGVGSVGTRCAIALLVSGNGDPLFLQFKEARQSVLEPYAGASPFTHRGERVVVGQRLMQAASDMFLGWTTGVEGYHYYVRQLNDAKIKPVIEVMKPVNLSRYAWQCGRLLARAHARSLDAVTLAAYLGRSDQFADGMTAFAEAYADQTERDHDALRAALRAGRIDADTHAY